MVSLPNRLVPLLRRASAEMLAAGEIPYLGAHDTCAGLGRFVSAQTDALAGGQQVAARELWLIFAPTCDWDDAGGSRDLASEIFELLGTVHSPAGT